MALIDIPTPAPTIIDIANNIRQHLASVVSLADVRLLQIRNLVREYGRSNIAAELGADASDMLTVYTKLKEAIETAKQVSVEDLPT